MSVPLVLESVTLKSDDKVLSNYSNNSSMKHMFPKTKISHVILHENTSQQRHLTMVLSRLNHRQERIGNTYTMSIKNFSDKQKQKHGKWKREDEMRTLGMNLPHIPPPGMMGDKRLDSAQTLYRSPTYLDNGTEASMRRENTIILPYMSIEREHIKYLTHKQNTFVTRLPTIINVDEQKLGKYKRFCNTSINDAGNILKDQRYRKLAKILTPTTSVSLRKTVNHLVGGSDEETKSVVTEFEEPENNLKSFKSHRNMHKVSKRSPKPFLMVEGESPNLKCRPVIANNTSIKVQNEKLFEERMNQKTLLESRDYTGEKNQMKMKSLSNINNKNTLPSAERPELTRAGTDLILLKSKTGHMLEGEKL